MRVLILSTIVFLIAPLTARQDSLQISGFGWARGSASDQDGALAHEDVSIFISRPLPADQFREWLRNSEWS